MDHIQYDICYDDELDPPSWTIKKYFEDENEAIVIIDIIFANSKEHAERLLKEMKAVKQTFVIETVKGVSALELLGCLEDTIGRNGVVSVKEEA